MNKYQAHSVCAVTRKCLAFSPSSNVSSNPFSTRFIRPGAIPFIFSAGESAESLVDHLRVNNWRGQIIGPHGSGKSTLLAALLPALQAAGRTVACVSLHQ